MMKVVRITQNNNTNNTQKTNNVKNFLTNKTLKRLRVMMIVLTSVLFISMFATAISHAYGTPFVGVALTLGVLAIVMVVANKSNRSERRFAAFMSCVGITAALTLNCPNDLIAGVNATFYIANKDDVSTVTYDGTNAQLVTSITMASGKQFFKVEGQLQSTEPTVKMIKGKYANQFEHSVKFLVFRIDAEAKLQLLKMKDGNFCVIVENNYTSDDGSTRYDGYGFKSGLKAEAIERNSNDTENLGAFSVELKTQEYARESLLPVTIYAGSASATTTLISTITAAA